jgi:aspartyl-tRNA(Asn)/glutamyl-tRNA(Gln) amidotransferase subunit A
VSIPESKVSSQWVKLSCAAYYVLACAEASSNLSRYDGVRYGKDHDAVTSDDHIDSVFADMTILEQHISATRASGFGDEVQRRVLAGTSVLSSDRFHTHYEAAAIVRAKLSQSLENVFRCSVEEGDSDEVDAILVPTALSFPVVLDPRKEARPDSTSAFANDVMTIPISLGGFPSISVPIHESKSPDTVPHSGDNSPVGLQLFGPRGSEELVLKTARTLEQLI